MVVGAFGPWATIDRLDVSVDGTDSGKDGWLVVGAAGVALLFLAIYVAVRRRWPAVLTLLAGCAAAAVAAYDIADIQHVTTGLDSLIDPGWGIYVALAGSISLVLASLGLLIETRGRGEATA
jgi:hypothetical protein